jgi:choline-glycine betaine transporter
MEGNMVEEYDDIEALEAKETANKLPIGWQILFWGLILWGIYYFVAYTPAISGWSQAKAYEESINK